MTPRETHSMKRPRGKTVKKARKPRAAAKKTENTLPSGKPFLEAIMLSMPSSALAIGNAATTGGGNVTVTGSYRGVSGIVGILHNSLGNFQASQSASSGNGGFTINFTGINSGQTYTVTVLGLATGGTSPGTVIFDSMPAPL
jgi:hypothetical protein